MNWVEIVVNSLLSVGAFTALRAGVARIVRHWRSGSNSEQRQAELSAAERLNDIAIELVAPLKGELREARAEASGLRAELEACVVWMQNAHRILEANNLPVDPLPFRNRRTS